MKHTALCALALFVALPLTGCDNTPPKEPPVSESEMEDLDLDVDTGVETTPEEAVPDEN